MKARNALPSRREAIDGMMPFGKRLNNRGRALIHDALGRLMAGGDLAMEPDPETGRTFLDQLAHQLRRDPLGSILRVDAATPSDEDSGAKGDGAAGMVANIGALYLQAVQQVNREPLKTIEGTIGVQPEPSDW